MPSLARAQGYENALQGKQPSAVQGVSRAEELTDDRAGSEGGPWKTRRTALLRDSNAFVVFDLGRPTRIRAAWLQADHNDTYRIELSADGRSWSPLWDAPAVRRGGLQARETRSLDAEGRYVRLRALRGDGSFAVSELQLYTGSGAELPRPRFVNAVPLADRLRDKTLVFGLSLLVLMLVPARRRRAIAGLALLLAALGAGQFGLGVLEAWPVEPREVALIRGVVAGLAAFALAREHLSPARWPAWPAAVSGVLGLCAALAALAFYNLGHPQFYNEQLGRWTFAHYLDLRQYYPAAKYHAELGYDRQYDADLAAYQAAAPGLGPDAIAALPIRDLTTLELSRAGERSASIARVKARFSEARFREYTRDALFFRHAMGDALYLETLIDYGANATPVWMAIAHVLFSVVSPSDAAFSWLGAIDLVLLALMFFAIGRTFGARTLCVSLVVFGANDFMMYGTNWSGATLRHDWLAYLGLAACALRAERFRLGGALLAMAALIRAFPLVALVAAFVPALWRVAESARARRAPLRELLARESASLQIALGAAVALGLGLLVPMIVLGPQAWFEWFTKVAGVDADPHPTSLGLRNLIAGSEDQARVLLARWPLYAAALVAYLAAIALALRRLRPEQAAMLGLCLVPVLFNPTTYYLHLVFLFALVALPQAEGVGVSRLDGLGWITLSSMCALQYLATLEPDLSVHFGYSTWILFVMLAILLGFTLAGDERVRRFWTTPKLE